VGDLQQLKHQWSKIQWISYIWLAYLPYSISTYLPIKRPRDLFWLLMLGAFLVTYILVVEVPRWRAVTMSLELVITGLFALLGANDYMIIFPGCQVASILAYWPKRAFHWFLVGYYGFLLGGLLRAGLTTPNVFSWQDGAVMGLLFPLISPIFAYTLMRSLWREQQLHQTNRRLQAIIQRDERERIARDLHDTLGQSFSMITLKTELAQKLLVKAPERVSQELSDIAQTSRANLQAVRAIVNDLHQQSISGVLLTQSHNLLAADILLTTTGETAANQWPTQIQSRLAAVMSEALTNVIRHAHASRVQITFTVTRTTYQVIVQDDGHREVHSRPGANGIRGMRARMLEAAGTFALTHDRRGTRVVLTLPKER